MWYAAGSVAASDRSRHDSPLDRRGIYLSSDPRPSKLMTVDDSALNALQCAAAPARPAKFRPGRWSVANRPWLFATCEHRQIASRSRFAECSVARTCMDDRQRNHKRGASLSAAAHFLDHTALAKLRPAVHWAQMGQLNFGGTTFSHQFALASAVPGGIGLRLEAPTQPASHAGSGSSSDCPLPCRRADSRLSVPGGSAVQPTRRRYPNHSERGTEQT